MRTLALCGLLIACSHSSAPPPPPAAPPAAPAKRAGLEADCHAALAETPPADMTPEERARWDALDPVRIALTRLCIEDAWSAAATACLAKAPPGGAATCMDANLTAPQMDRVMSVVRDEPAKPN